MNFWGDWMDWVLIGVFALLFLSAFLFPLLLIGSVASIAAGSVKGRKE